MENKSRNITDLSARILNGVRKAVKKLVVTSAANNESLVISDKEGNIRKVPAKELLDTLQK